MTEMIERAALKVRVIMLDRFGYEMGKEESVVLVRAALAAMREPTEAMIQAHPRSTISPEMSALIRSDWGAMIDAALGVQS
jgi:hypothetical protein